MKGEKKEGSRKKEREKSTNIKKNCEDKRSKREKGSHRNINENKAIFRVSTQCKRKALGKKGESSHRHRHSCR